MGDPAFLHAVYKKRDIDGTNDAACEVKTFFPVFSIRSFLFERVNESLVNGNVTVTCRIAGERGGGADVE